MASLETLRGRLAAYSRWANESDVTAATAPARRAFMSRFLLSVDPHSVLPEQERERRALAARRAYFTKLALASAKSRARRSSKASAKTGREN
jgi:hypothetical protein